MDEAASFFNANSTIVTQDCAPIKYGAEQINEYVISQIDNRCADASIRTPTIFIYALILVLGVVGNVCTCLVIMRKCKICIFMFVV